MTIPHFVIMFSPKKINMQINAKVCIRSIEEFGKFSNFHITLVTPENEKNHLDSWFKKNKCEIFYYKNDNSLYCPWNFGPRWYVEPKSELYVALDADVICCKDITSLLQEFIDNKSFNAVEAVACPFSSNAFETWRKLYNAAGIELSDDLYIYRNYRNNNKNQLKDNYGPFYPNCGVLFLNSILLKEIKKVCPEAVKITNKICRQNYYFPQIVSSLIISLLNIKVNELNSKWNMLESFDKYEDDVFFYHHNCHAIRGDFSLIRTYQTSNPWIDDNKTNLNKKIQIMKPALEKKIKLL